MARQKRGGFRTPEIRGTLGTLLRSTLQQAGAVKDALGEVLDRGTREGRARLDDFRADRRSSKRRTDAVAELGEIVLDLIRRGEIDLGELPEARDVIDHLDAIDAAASAAATSGGTSKYGDDDGGASYLDRGLRTRVDDEFDPGARRDPRETAFPPSRQRFDGRREPARSPGPATHHHHHDEDGGRDHGHSHAQPRDDDPRRYEDERDVAASRSQVSTRASTRDVRDPREARDARAPLPARSSRAERGARDDSPRPRGPGPERHRADADGTVSSASAGASRVWRPIADDRTPPPGSRAAAPAPAAPTRSGIRFDPDDDADLADFMHPDDIPPKSDPDRT